MAWICEQEGIEADAEALAVLAQAGEGSVRDSLSALDQAIACCGARLTAPEVRALLGSFALESLEKVTQSLAAGDSRAMLEIVDDLERNGHNLQHFSRELSRYFRNLVVARIAGAEGAGARLIAASAAQREKLSQIAAGFSEEDLTRYLQLSLDLFRDLQFSLQPRFHLEIGLLRLVQAGKLLPIEQALAGLGEAPARPAPPVRPAAPPPPPAAPRPTPFELDRARKAAKPSEPPRSPESSRSFEPPQSKGANALASQPASPAPQTAAAIPATNNDWRAMLHAALMELGLPYTADAVENARVVENAGELQFTVAKTYKLALREEDLRAALRHMGAAGARPLRIKVIIGDAGEPVAPLGGSTAEDEAIRTRAGQPRSAALPRSLRRRGPQNSQSQGVVT